MTTKNELLKTIRLFCNECMGGTPAHEKPAVEKYSDIEHCTDVRCAFYIYRSGKDPHPCKQKQEQARKNFLSKQVV